MSVKSGDNGDNPTLLPSYEWAHLNSIKMEWNFKPSFFPVVMRFQCCTSHNYWIESDGGQNWKDHQGKYLRKKMLEISNSQIWANGN